MIMSSSESGGAVDVICYDALTGDILWMGDDAGSTYSSLQLAQIDGVMQLLMFSNARGGDATGQRIVSRATDDGALLWRYQGKGMGNAMATPLVIDGSRVIDFDGNEGAIALQISKRSQDGKSEWIANRQWNQNRAGWYADWFVQGIADRCRSDDWGIVVEKIAIGRWAAYWIGTARNGAHHERARRVEFGSRL